MADNFAVCLPLVLVHEGGYVNHPKDPGGATNRGVTQRTYDAWRKRQGQAARSVKMVTEQEVAEIYRAQYWAKVAGDDLPSGLDYAVFDFAVNSGPARAAQFLQRAVGVEADGIIGAQTLAAVSRHDPAKLVAAICDARLAWLKRLKHWATFGKGWSRRVAEVKENATNMAAALAVQAPAGSTPGMGAGEEKASATIKDLAKDPKAWAGAGGLVSAVGGVMQGSGPVQWALAAAIVIGVAFFAYRAARA